MDRGHVPDPRTKPLDRLSTDFTPARRCGAPPGPRGGLRTRAPTRAGAAPTLVRRPRPSPREICSDTDRPRAARGRRSGARARSPQAARPSRPSAHVGGAERRRWRPAAARPAAHASLRASLGRSRTAPRARPTRLTRATLGLRARRCSIAAPPRRGGHALSSAGARGKRRGRRDSRVTLRRISVRAARGRTKGGRGDEGEGKRRGGMRPAASGSSATPCANFSAPRLFGSR